MHIVDQGEFPAPVPRPSQPKPRSGINTAVRLIVAAIVVSALFIIAGAFLLGTGTGGDGDGDTLVTFPEATPVDTTPIDSSSQPAPTTAVPPDAAPTASASPTAAPDRAIISDEPLTLRGIGAIESGMTVAQAQAAIGAELIPLDESNSECQYAAVAGDFNSPRFMVLTDTGALVDGTVVRIEALDGQTTRSGIRIGSTKADVLAAYGDRIVESPHKYLTDPGDQYLTFVPADSVDSNYRVIFETDDDVVTSVRSGILPAVEWVEGCG